MVLLDDLGHEVVLSGRPSRVVSLVPSLTEAIEVTVPGLVVAWGAGFVVMIGAAIAMLLAERFVVPDLPQMLMLTASALFLTAGHFCIFMSFRVGAVGAVAPFYYTGTIWALIAGIVVFNAIPNELARVGIALILVSGIVVVWMDARRNWRSA